MGPYVPQAVYQNEKFQPTLPLAACITAFCSTYLAPFIARMNAARRSVSLLRSPL